MSNVMDETDDGYEDDYEEEGMGYEGGDYDPSGDEVQCPECGEPMYGDADRCPACGQWVLQGGRRLAASRRKWFTDERWLKAAGWAVLLAIGSAIAVGLWASFAR